MKRWLLHKCLVKHFGTMCAIGEKIIIILNSCFKICSEFGMFTWDKEIRRGTRTWEKCTLTSLSVTKSNHQNQNSDEFKTLPYPCNEQVPWSCIISCIFPTTLQLPVMPKLGLFPPGCPFLLHSRSPSLSSMASTEQGLPFSLLAAYGNRNSPQTFQKQLY